MTVEPGFGGQSFIYDTLDKISSIRSKANELGLSVDIEVDGGINAETSPLVRRSGANELVSGSYLFKAEDMSDAANKLKEGSGD